MKTFCFKSKNAETLKSFSQIDQILKHKGQISKEDFPEILAKRCNRKAELAENINALYKELCENKISERRISEVKNFAFEQFSDVGNLLKDIVNEIKNYDNFDLELSKKIASELKKMKLKPIDIYCRYDNWEKIFIEIEVADINKKELEKLNLTKKLSKICSRQLGLPCISSVGEICKIQFSEKPVFDIQIGIAQHICKNGVLCGDNYTYFNDGMGRMTFILSDGMGTGGRAAIEGAMACKIMENLIKSGLSFLTATKITNSALLAKSDDEVLATLDILSVDLCTGKTKLLKAGAPLTFLRKGDKVIRCAPNSLPIGILKEVNAAECSNILANDDRILIVSDGAVSDGDALLENIFKVWGNEDSQTFANLALQAILSSKKSDFDDDITIVAMKLSDIGY